MSTNEIVSKAKLLDEAVNYDGVVTLLEKYVRDHADDREAAALFQKNWSMKMLVENKVDLIQIKKDDKTRFMGLSNVNALRFSALNFANIIAYLYLQHKPEVEQENIICNLIDRELTTLDELLHDYDIMKAQLDMYCESLRNCGYAKNFYKHLCYVVDWQTETTVNVLKYISEKVSTAAVIQSEETIYGEYTKEMTEGIFPFDEKPPLSGDRVIIVNIKSQEQLDFWKGYFAFLKKVREEEYATFKNLISNENSEYNCIPELENYILQSWYKQVECGAITTEDVAKINNSANFYIGGKTESAYTSRIEEAEKCFSTITLNPIELIKAKASGFLKKFKK